MYCRGIVKSSSVSVADTSGVLLAYLMRSPHVTSSLGVGYNVILLFHSNLKRGLHLELCVE